MENSAAGTSVWLGVGNDTTGSTFTGTLTDAGGGTGLLGLAKLGGDTFTLDGTNTFSGPTIVEGGILDVATAFGNSAVQLAGGQLQGNAHRPRPAWQPRWRSAPRTRRLLTAGLRPIGHLLRHRHPDQLRLRHSDRLGCLLRSGDGTDPPHHPHRTARQLEPLALGVGDHYIVAKYTSNSESFVSGAVGEFDQEIDPAGTTTTVSIADNTNSQDGKSGLRRPVHRYGGRQPGDHRRRDPTMRPEWKPRDGGLL